MGRFIKFEKPRRKVWVTFIHCSASSNPAHDNVATMRRWHMASPRNWSDVGYHFFIRRDGTIETGRPINRIPAAQRGHNTGSIAICLHGGGGEPPKNDFTPAQHRALRMLTKQIDITYDFEMRFRGHNEVSNKACPVLDVNEVLGTVDGYYSTAYAMKVGEAPVTEEESKPLIASSTVQSVVGIATATSGAVATVSKDIVGLSATQWYVIGGCAAVAALLLGYIVFDRWRRGREMGF